MSRLPLSNTSWEVAGEGYLGPAAAGRRGLGHDGCMTAPSPRTPDPMAAPPLRWGILGPGGIARSMVHALRARTRQQVVAVGSRDQARATAYASELEIPRAHGSYRDLVADPTVDIVYVATPHSEHREHALLAIAAGKHVLVEKAFTRNHAEAEEVLAAAEAAGGFCMEAMWTRFLPGTDVLRQLLAEGALGEIEVVFADHGQPLWPDGPQRLADPRLAGGALLDLGVYPVSFASFALGGIASVRAVGALTPAGVDRQEAMVVTGPGGGLGVLHSTMAARTSVGASVCGASGRVDIGDHADPTDRWYGPTPLRYTSRNRDKTWLWAPEERKFGLHYEAAEAARCISEGRRESPLLPWSETLAVMAVLDDVRAQLGVRYPGEQ